MQVAKIGVQNKRIPYFYFFLFYLVLPTLSLAGSSSNNDSQVQAQVVRETPSSSQTVRNTSPLTQNITSQANQSISKIDTKPEMVQVTNTAANLSTSTAIVACAEGANTLNTNSTNGGIMIDSCLQSFQTANQLKDYANKYNEKANLLDADYDLLNSERASAIFADLMKNYGISKEEFVQLMLKAQGDSSIMGSDAFLDSLSKGKFSRQQIIDALLAAKSLAEQEQDKVLMESRLNGIADEFLYKISPSSISGANGSKVVSLKSSITNSLLRNPSSTPTKAEKNEEKIDKKSIVFFGQSRVTPLETFSEEKEAAAEQEDDYELSYSLFDRVRRKYQERTVYLSGD